MLKGDAGKSAISITPDPTAKVDSDVKGKTKGTGKSSVVKKQVYLETADTVPYKLLDKENLYDPMELQKKELGLPVALFEVAERIGPGEIIGEVAPWELESIAVSDFILIGAINRVGNHTSKKSKLGGSFPMRSSTSTNWKT